jgi:hypothetical protein
VWSGSLTSGPDTIKTNFTLTKKDDPAASPDLRADAYFVVSDYSQSTLPTASVT